ncbi:hypothetical protein [Parashewanella curva]|nr:hypothetical protein [Parashewanella curva]
MDSAYPYKGEANGHTPAMPLTLDVDVKYQITELNGSALQHSTFHTNVKVTHDPEKQVFYGKPRNTDTARSKQWTMKDSHVVSCAFILASLSFGLGIGVIIILLMLAQAN